MSAGRFRRVIFAAVVVVVLAGIYGATRIHHPASKPGRPAAASRLDVSSAIRVCPAPGSAGPTASALAVSAIPGSAKAGSAVVTALSPVGSSSAGSALATLKQPGILQASAVPVAPALTAAEQAGQPGSSPSVSTQPGQGGVEVSAAGALAQGLEVEQTGPGGLVTAQCGAPGTSFWFAGPGQKSVATIELYLTNTGDAPADAQVQALTDAANGAPQVLGNADNGITVPPHGMVVQSLNGLLQGSGLMALNVSTTVGQVTAAVRETNSGDQAGSWLPALQAPAQHVVIPGAPAEAGSRDLFIAVPGTGAAQIKITAITQRGSYQPTGGTGIDLLGGSVSDIQLPSMSGIAGALSITSSVPVVAAMLVPGGPAGGIGALAVSSGPVLEQGVLAANPAGQAGLTQLVLSAPGKAASVRIAIATATTPASQAAGQVVKIPAKSSVVVPVAPPASSNASQFTFVVTPLAGSGPVYGGNVITADGSLQSILPVPSSLTWIPLPGVSESLPAILGS
jgi:Family of unknown function (DUF5719)